VARDPIRETIDYVAITRLQSAYGDAVNRRAWDEFANLFLPTATIRVDTVTNPAVDVTGPAQLGSFIAGAIERFEFFEFVILNAHVEIGDDAHEDGAPTGTARARVFMCELRQEQASGRWSNAFGVYHDDYARIDERWWFSRRRYQSLARTGRAEVFPFPKDL
jgi:hypothetical protein